MSAKRLPTCGRYLPTFCQVVAGVAVSSAGAEAHDRGLAALSEKETVRRNVSTANGPARERGVEIDMPVSPKPPRLLLAR